jgi:hypothetical protein
MRVVEAAPGVRPTRAPSRGEQRKGGPSAAGATVQLVRRQGSPPAHFNSREPRGPCRWRACGRATASCHWRRPSGRGAAGACSRRPTGTRCRPACPTRRRRRSASSAPAWGRGRRFLPILLCPRQPPAARAPQTRLVPSHLPQPPPKKTPNTPSPPTALCMLEQFVELQPGDVVIQNGATSAVGQVRRGRPQPPPRGPCCARPLLPRSCAPADRPPPTRRAPHPPPAARHPAVPGKGRLHPEHHTRQVRRGGGTAMAVLAWPPAGSPRRPAPLGIICSVNAGASAVALSTSPLRNPPQAGLGRDGGVVA